MKSVKYIFAVSTSEDEVCFDKIQIETDILESAYNFKDYTIFVFNEDISFEDFKRFYHYYIYTILKIDYYVITYLAILDKKKYENAYKELEVDFQEFLNTSTKKIVQFNRSECIF